jgi:hypothetical protein
MDLAGDWHRCVLAVKPFEARMTLGHQRFSLRGLGDASTSVDSLTASLGDFGTWLSDSMIGGVPNYALLIGGFIFYKFVSGTSQAVTGFQRKRKSSKAVAGKKRAAALRAAARDAEAA